MPIVFDFILLGIHVYFILRFDVLIISLSFSLEYFFLSELLKAEIKDLRFLIFNL